MPATGGQPKQVTTLRDNERAHRFPSFLPDGKRFLYSVGSLLAGDNRLMLGDIESGQGTALAQNASNGQYVAPGFLLFVRNGALIATRFDSRSGKLTGEPVVVAPAVGYHPAKNLGMFAAGGSSTLAFVPLNYPETEFRMVDRTGHLDSLVVEAAAHQMADLSPDGQRIATTRLDAPSSSERVDLWVTDVAAQRSRRVSTDPKGFVDVRWTPDGQKILVTGGSHGILDLIIFDLAGKSEVLLETPNFKRHPDLSPDGKWILYAESHPQTQWDIRVMSLQPRKPPVTFAASTGADGGARFSPDGRFIAFMSESGGAPDIYVKRFPDSGEQWQISTGGGLWPRWSPNGRELYYEQPGGMLMAVAIEKQPSFDAGVPKPLFPLPRGVTPDSPVLSGVTPDGKRFLLAAAVKSDAETGFQVVLNWQSRTSLHP